MRGSSERIERILKVIPYDGWVSASQISTETGLSSHKVSGIIRRHLRIEYVEWKHTKILGRGSKLYRRLRLIGKEREQ